MNPIKCMNLEGNLSQRYHAGAYARDVTSASEYHPKHPIKRVVTGTVRFDRQTGEIIEKKGIHSIQRSYDFQI